MSTIYIHIALVIVCMVVKPTHAQEKDQFHFDQKAVYKITYQSDSSDRNSQKQQMSELLIGEEQSLFRSFQKAHGDSSYLAYINNKVITMEMPTIVPMGEINLFNYQIVKDLQSGDIIVYDEYTGSNLNTLEELNYYFEDPGIIKKWILSEDTLTINGHLCQSAEIEFGGRKWKAWFSPEISAYPDGPYKFRGLPGLIFRIYDTKKTWDFELVNLSKVDTLININVKEGIKLAETTQLQLYKDRRYYQKNQIEIREAAGHNFGDNRAEIKNMLEDYIRRDNNWIELYP